MNSLLYPEADRDDVVDILHGDEIADPYRWLEDTFSTRTRQWVDKQNELTESWLGQVDSREAIRTQLETLWNFPRRKAPWRRGRHWFQMRNHGLQNHDVLWTMDAADAEGRVLLDPNLRSDDGSVALYAALPSLDGSVVAYALSQSGSDWRTWRFLDEATGRDLPDSLNCAKSNLAVWSPAGLSFFYSLFDEPPEGEELSAPTASPRVMRHRLGTDQAEDEVVYEANEHPDWLLNPTATPDGRWLVITITRGTNPETRLLVLDLENPKATLSTLVDDFDSSNQVVGAADTTFLLLTDYSAPRGRIVAVDLDRSKRAYWREVVREDDACLVSATEASGRLVCSYLEHGHSVIRVCDRDGVASHDIPLPGVGHAELACHPEDAVVHLLFTSFLEPGTVIAHDLDARTTRSVFQPPIDLALDSFAVQQVFVPSDGATIPLTLVHRSDVEPTGATPSLLYGYGGFNQSVVPTFDITRAAFVMRGGLLAVANLRGGGEYGRQWYDAGRLANKQNVFDDFASCARWLAQSGWTSPEHLAINGVSNGGLLVGALLTQQPDLFAAAVCEVGVLDMIRFHKFTIGWAWASDYGSPDDALDYKILRAYSPLHNVTPGESYPATLILTGDHDDRVLPGHSFKFAAAMQSAQRGTAPVLLRVTGPAGHGVGKPVAAVLAERADVLGFLDLALSPQAESS